MGWCLNITEYNFSIHGYHFSAWNVLNTFVLILSQFYLMAVMTWHYKKMTATPHLMLPDAKKYAEEEPLSIQDEDQRLLEPNDSSSNSKKETKGRSKFSWRCWSWKFLLPLYSSGVRIPAAYFIFFQLMCLWFFCLALTFFISEQDNAFADVAFVILWAGCGFFDNVVSPPPKAIYVERVVCE